MSPKLGIEFRDKIIRAFTEFEDDQVYVQVLDLVLSSIESEYGIFGYINENGDVVCPSMTKKVWEKCQIPDKDIIFYREDWINSKVIWARALIEEKTKYSNQPLSPPEGHIPMNRVIVVPIMHRKKLIGILEVANKKSNYTKDDINALETFARYISPLLFSRLESIKQRKEISDLKNKKSKREKVIQLDNIDKEILYQLYLDGRQSNTQIGSNLKNQMSHTGVQNRIKKLIDLNLLKIQANINFNSLNLKVAYINIKLQKYEDIDKFISKYKSCPRMFLLSRITGRYHLKIGIIGRNIDDLNDFLNYCLLADTQLINLSEVIFASDISKPDFIPLDFFEINNQNTPCGKNCVDCDSYINDKCFGCDFL
ncbi:MAG: GAF domain-containing protein [Candidatus Heimdallarchaeota archaeon]